MANDDGSPVLVDIVPLGKDMEIRSLNIDSNRVELKVDHSARDFTRVWILDDGSLVEVSSSN